MALKRRRSVAETASAVELKRRLEKIALSKMMGARNGMILTVNRLSKTYSSRNFALREISFAIQPHSFTAVLGPSGAGKTTLLRCILGLLQPEAGTIWFEDQSLLQASAQQLRQARSQIGLVAQQFNLVRRRTALENCLAGRLQALPLWRCVLNQFPKPLLREGLASLDRVGLADVAFQRADQLSGGQQQRVAIARALTQGAKLILADEPISSLDPESAHLVLGLLRSLCQEEGLTVLCNLHQVEFAKQYSDRLLGIRNGELVLDQLTAETTKADLQQLYIP